ncbi:MAG TPA: SET domain-containing protein [Candidatus Kapabacteria bacterium]|nr:SET domain-containing protein [Candidatus Kapabacteria bacterium]
MNVEDIFIGNGSMFGKGMYANRDFKKGEIVIQYHLRSLSEDEYEQLPKEEHPFVHTHWGIKYLYSIPERYVNHSVHPNTLPNQDRTCDVAVRDIQKGEAITTDATKDDI